MLKKIVIVAAVGVFALSSTPSNAAEKVITDPGILERMKVLPLSVQDEITRTECGDCHMTFSPSKLTATAWKKIMGDLSNHFGEDATLDAATVKHIEDYLVSNALDRPDPKTGKIGIRTKMTLKSWKKKGIVDPLRITETPGWLRHHTKKLHYKNMVKAVGYAGGSNCIQCHGGAEYGLYEEFEDQYGGK